jgi:hypothetical protein
VRVAQASVVLPAVTAEPAARQASGAQAATVVLVGLVAVPAESVEMAEPVGRTA